VAASVSLHDAARLLSAGSARAEISSGGSAALASALVFLAGGGACRTAWPLVPPKPNELTPAMRASSASAIGAVTTSRLSSSRWMFGFGSSKLIEGGTTRLSSASIALRSPAMPEAASRWPTLVLTEPIGSGRERWRASASLIALVSIGSPAGVPVPCASKKARASGATPVSA